MNPFQSLRDYEEFVYTLPQSFPAVQRSTLVVVPRGKRVAVVQPHPENPVLASTFPHHKHVPPGIKHNRITAPEMSFVEPNLPALIREIEGLVEQANIQAEPLPVVEAANEDDEGEDAKSRDDAD